MADKEIAPSIIYNSLAAGEISPNLYARTDLAKFRQGCATMRNFFVDYRGGASTRPGTQLMGQAGSSGFVRLIPFSFSPAIGQSYILVFSNLKLRFIKNPGGPSYPNSSNSGFILSGGVPYEVATPWLEADLPFLKFQQSADVIYITRHGYVRQKLSRLSDTNWTLTAVTTNVGQNSPTIDSISISPLPSGSTDPQKTRYMYQVSMVDTNGVETLPSTPLISSAGIDIGATQGTVIVYFHPDPAATNVAYYKVYKALPSPGNFVPDFAEQFGFAGYSYGTVFVDSNIVPDFTKTPLRFSDPFQSGGITGYSISNQGGSYPVGATTLNVTDATGSGALLFPVLNNHDPAGTGNITGIIIANPGHGYTAPTVSAVGSGGSGFAATLVVGPTTGIDPDVVGLHQQRLVYASTLNQPSTLFGSRPGNLDDFRASNPIAANDSYQYSIVSQQVTDILWLQSMPGGLVIGTNSGIVQVTGGSSSVSSPVALTPENGVVVPQSYYGSADLRPIVINYDLLFVKAGGSFVIDLQYNFFVNIYTGTDITSLSAHLFYPRTVTDWAYQDTPKKIVWAVRDDGALLSLTYFKEQEVLGWARHDTQGLFESVCSIREGSIDAVYVSANRNGTRYIERFADRIYNQAADAWCLDSALSIQPNFPAATLTPGALTGSTTFTASAAVFGSGDVGKAIISGSAMAIVTSFTDTTHVVANITQDFPSVPNTGAPLQIASGAWRLDPLVSNISGLTHLNSMSVYALVDGIVQGPFTVSAGSITLTTPGYSVVAGLSYSCQLEPLYFDEGGEATIQGRRKKFEAVTVRVLNAARLKYGTSFSTLQEWRQGYSSTDPSEFTQLPGLFLGDQRIAIDPDFNVYGSICIEQDYPLPATVLGIILEPTMGDQ